MDYKIVFLFIAFFVFPYPVFSQDVNPCVCDSLNSSLKEPKLTGDVFQLSKISEGSQFFQNEWLLGDIQLANNLVVYNKNINYNGYIDELIFYESNSFLKVKMDKDLVSGFCLRDSKLKTVYTFTKIMIKKEFLMDSIIIFGQILYTNKLSLFAYRRVLSGAPIQVNSSGKVYYKDVYEPNPVYYFRFASGKTVGFKTLKRKTLFTLFPDKAIEIKAALKEKKQRRFKTEDDLIRVTDILNLVFDNIH